MFQFIVFKKIFVLIFSEIIIDNSLMVKFGSREDKWLVYDQITAKQHRFSLSKFHVFSALPFFLHINNEPNNEILWSETGTG